MSLKQNNTYKIYGNYDNNPHIWALFDLDWTLIRPEKGKFFNDDVPFLLLPLRKETLIHLDKVGYKIGIVTNQHIKGKNKYDNINNRLINFINYINDIFGHDNITIFVAFAEDEYRKPNIGWKRYINYLPGSFYVGDAAGREGDFSDSDLKFAQNMGLTFYIPEVFFGITIIQKKYFKDNLFIIMMGAPGSGKSTYANNIYNLYHNYCNVEIICSDDYKPGWKKIFSVLDKELSKVYQNELLVQTNNSQMRNYQNGLPIQKKNIIIYDATNPRRERRLESINLGKKYNIKTIIIHILNPGEEHNKLREHPVPEIAYRKYWSDLENPDSNIEKVDVFEI